MSYRSKTSLSESLKDPYPTLFNLLIIMIRINIMKKGISSSYPGKPSMEIFNKKRAAVAKLFKAIYISSMVRKDFFYLSHIKKLI